MKPVKIHKDYRKTGISQTLIKFAAEDSPCNVFVIAAETIGPAIKMYQSIGFEIHETRASLCKGELVGF